MGEVGCFTLDLYCDNRAMHPSGMDCPDWTKPIPGSYHTMNFTGWTAAEARREARKVGWVYLKSPPPEGSVTAGHRATLCPACAREHRKRPLAWVG